MRHLFYCLCLLFPLCAVSPAHAVSLMNHPETAPSPAEKTPDDISSQKELLVKAQSTLESMLSNPDYPSLLNLATRAKAILIVPRMLKLSFLIGGHGGSGVLVLSEFAGAAAELKGALLT
ncbi:MAG: hypothetical protein K2Q32_09175, partial [Alphaproteobacteria bacterium]|nr:hypothetical protein [Alphaproteobacteria bacterium]